MAYKSPVYHVIPVPIEKVRPNTYNPNAVAPPEMRLLYESIRADGYTMPIVCYYAKSQDIYVIVDGFHRYRVMLEHPDIYEREGGGVRLAGPGGAHPPPPQPGKGQPRRGPDEQHRQGASRAGPFRRMDRKASRHGQRRDPSPQADHRADGAFQGCKVRAGMAAHGRGRRG